MKKNWSSILALVLTLCLPVLGLAEDMTRSNIENAVARGIFRKAPHQKIWELVAADDGDGLRAYLTANKEKLTKEDFMVVWENYRGGFGWSAHDFVGEHVYCHAARKNKINAGKVLIDVVIGDLKYVPNHCYRFQGSTLRVAEKEGISYKTSRLSGLDTYSWEQANSELACYLLKTNQLEIEEYRWYRYTMFEGGCEEEYLSYALSHDLLKFPKDISYMDYVELLSLAEKRPDLVPTPDFQKALVDWLQEQSPYFYLSWFERERLKSMLLPENKTEKLLRTIEYYEGEIPPHSSYNKDILKKNGIKE